jgi:aspartate aminotransferase
MAKRGSSGTDNARVFHNLNLNVRGLPPSATITINDLSNQLIREGRRVYKLGLGQSPFPVPESVVRALQDNAHRKEYLPAAGLMELREAVANQHQREFGTDTTADDVLIGPGSKELMFILQLAYYGDLVIPSPSWVSYVPQAKIIGRHIRSLMTCKENRWLLTAEQLDEHCALDPGRPRLLILNYPSNPTGLTFSAAQLKDLADVAEKYKLVVLSDEIYGRLHHTGAHRSIIPLYPEGTVLSSGLSKWCGAGGWRLGCFVFPRQMRWLFESMVTIATETFTSTSAPIQYAAVAAFQDGPEITKYLGHAQGILCSLGQYLSRRLQEGGFDVFQPDGAFYLFPDFSSRAEHLARKGIHTSTDFCQRLLDETGVAILPGANFGRPAAELTARLSYVDFDGSAALAAASSLPPAALMDESFLRDYCGKVLQAVELLIEWVDS